MNTDASVIAVQGHRGSIQDEYAHNASSYGSVPFTSRDDRAHKRIAVPVRVEPKVFFANERTFLSWLNF
ncbi:vacuolar transporter chaperone, partial [Coemansia sp. RSA 2610]